MKRCCCLVVFLVSPLLFFSAPIYAKRSNKAPAHAQKAADNAARKGGAAQAKAEKAGQKAAARAEQGGAVAQARVEKASTKAASRIAKAHSISKRENTKNLIKHSAKIKPNTRTKEARSVVLPAVKKGVTTLTEDQIEKRARLIDGDVDHFGLEAVATNELEENELLMAEVEKVQLGDQEGFVVDFYGNDLLHVHIEEEVVINTAVETLLASGAPPSFVLLEAREASRLLGGVINLDMHTQASTITVVGQQVILS